MAEITISIKDESSAKQWLETVREINSDYHQAMADASETLINMKDFADGTLVDEFYKFGENLLKAAKETFKAIDEIADTVNKVVSTVKKFQDGVVSGITKLAGKIFN